MFLPGWLSPSVFSWLISLFLYVTGFLPVDFLLLVELTIAGFLPAISYDKLVHSVTSGFLPVDNYISNYHWLSPN